jgi:hypothetical protein
MEGEGEVGSDDDDDHKDGKSENEKAGPKKSRSIKQRAFLPQMS